MKKKERTNGFTLVELLVVIAVIALLATIAFVALAQGRVKARDARRVADIRQFQSGLELYFNNQVLSTYPPVTTGHVMDNTILGPNIMVTVPDVPSPPDGTCTVSNNRYMYTSFMDQSLATPCTNATQSCGWYQLTFCLGSVVGVIQSGSRIADPSGIH